MTVKTRHTELSECADILSGMKSVTDAAVVPTPAADTERLEFVVAGDVVPPHILAILSDHGVGIDPDASATRGDPTVTVAVGR